MTQNDASQTPASPVKADLRRAALARRDALSSEARTGAAAALAATVPGLPVGWAGCVVSGFWPIRSEIDPRPLMQALATAGARLALPRVTADGLMFHLYAPGDTLERAGFGLSEPTASAPVVRPAVMLVPLAAFDRRGHRIGYGAGYYDRAIAALTPGLTIGVAYSCQEVPQVPDEPHDRPLDWIATEAGLVHCGRDGAVRRPEDS